ncbi:hypothetical protein D3C86_1884300 [compost metagenome]
MNKAIPPATINPPSNSCSSAVCFSPMTPSDHRPSRVPGTRPMNVWKNDARSMCRQWRDRAMTMLGNATMVMVVATVAIGAAWVSTAIARTTMPSANPVNACR